MGTKPIQAIEKEIFEKVNRSLSRNKNRRTLMRLVPGKDYVIREGIEGFYYPLLVRFSGTRDGDSVVTFVYLGNQFHSLRDSKHFCGGSYVLEGYTDEIGVDGLDVQISRCFWDRQAFELRRESNPVRTSLAQLERDSSYKARVMLLSKNSDMRL